MPPVGGLPRVSAPVASKGIGAAIAAGAKAATKSVGPSISAGAKAAPPRVTVPRSVSVGPSISAGAKIASPYSPSAVTAQAKGTRTGNFGAGPTKAQILATLRAQLHQKIANMDGGSLGGSGGALGAIEGIPIVGGAVHDASELGNSIVHTGGKILGNAGSDLINLAPSTLQGLEQLGVAGWDDITHARLGASNPDIGGVPLHGQSEVAQLADQAWHQSMLGHLARGDFSGAAKTFENHPIYSASELAGEYGAVGRLGGAVARSGALGDRVADLASTARADRSLLPYTDASGERVDALPGDVQHYSRNLLTKAAQVAMDKHPSVGNAIDQATFKAPRAMLNKRVDELMATSGARAQSALHDIKDKLAASKPEGAAAGVVPHAVMGTAGSQADFMGGLNSALDDLKTAENSGQLSPSALRANRTHQQNIIDFKNDPNVADAFASAHDYVTRQKTLDELQAHYGLLTTAEAERRALEPYATQNIPGAYVEKYGAKTSLANDIKLAVQRAKGADKRLVQTRLDHVKLTATSGDAAKAVRDAEIQLAKASQKEAQTRGFITGRFGQSRLQGEGNPLPGAAAGRLDRHVVSTDAATEHLATARQALAAAIEERKAYSQESIAAAKDDAKDAHQHVAMLKQSGPLKLKGLVQKNEDGTVSQLSNDAIKQHMEDNGVDSPAYIRMTAPNDSFRNIWNNWKMSRSGAKGKRFTGTGIKSGAWTPGYDALTRSQIGTVRKLQTAMTHDEFLNDAAIRGRDGAILRFNKTNHQQFADNFAKQTGHELVPMYEHPQSITDAQAAKIKTMHDVQGEAQLNHDSFMARHVGEDQQGIRDQNVVLTPKSMVDRYEQHLKVNASQNHALTALNRQFRNTVLPLSPKWLTGNVVEAGLRSSLVGASPRSWLLADRTIKAMREQGLGDQADHLERMATGGLHYGMNERMNDQQLGLTRPSPIGAVRNAPVIKQLSDAYQGFAQAVFHFNRRFESTAEKSVLGVHMQRQLQEMTGSWFQATKAEKAYVDELARGYANPRMAADAGRYIHETLGQYDRFSPQMKSFVQKYAPFSPWYANAAKFVYHTLPAKHPITQAVLLDVARADQGQWAKSHDVPHDSFAGISTGDLESALKTGPTDFLNLGRYTPEGAFTSGPLDFATGALLPQIQSSARNAVGQDAFGNALEGPKGKVTDKGAWALQAVNSLLESFGGPAQVAERVAEGGSTPYNTSKMWDIQTKPNTQRSPALGLPNVPILAGLNRVFNPFEPTHLGKTGAASTGGGTVITSKDLQAVGGGGKVVGSGGAVAP